MGGTFSRNESRTRLEGYRESYEQGFRGEGGRTDTPKIGISLNEWRDPVEEFGPAEGETKRRIQELSSTNYNVDAKEWHENCRIFDLVLKSIVEGVRKILDTPLYDGLNMSAVPLKQGSSREGLKVMKADEFDCIIEFEISGVQMEWEPLYGMSGHEVPGLLKLRLQGHSYPQWITKYEIVSGNGYVNTTQLQGKVFASILDQALSKINLNLANESASSYNVDQYTVKRSVKIPNLELTVCKANNSLFSKEEIFSIDFVPGILIKRDDIPDPYTSKEYSVTRMSCDRHAVMKWQNVNKKNPDIHEDNYKLCFSNSTSGYEKQVFDVARRNSSQRYILTACRVLKTYLKNTRSPNQLSSLISSYHIKNACMYCILLLTVPSDNNTLIGVKQALGYMVYFLKQAIEKKYLPHFFHGNPWVLVMFPEFPTSGESTPYNLLETTNSETHTQGGVGFKQALRELHGLYDEQCDLDGEYITRIDNIFP